MAFTMSGAEQVGGALAKAECTLAADALYLAELNRRPIRPSDTSFPRYRLPMPTRSNCSTCSVASATVPSCEGTRLACPPG
jgi:hypothetical protein